MSTPPVFTLNARTWAQGQIHTPLESVPTMNDNEQWYNYFSSRADDWLREKGIEVDVVGQIVEISWTVGGWTEAVVFDSSSNLPSAQDNDLEARDRYENYLRAIFYVGGLLAS